MGLQYNDYAIIAVCALIITWFAEPLIVTIGIHFSLWLVAGPFLELAREIRQVLIADRLVLGGLNWGAERCRFREERWMNSIAPVRK